MKVSTISFEVFDNLCSRCHCFYDEYEYCSLFDKQLLYNGKASKYIRLYECISKFPPKENV